MRLRSHLIGLVLAVLLPMIAFSAIALVMLGHSQRAAAERSALELSRALMSAVDENLRSTITTLEALATAPSLERNDLRAFYDEARRVVPAQLEWNSSCSRPMAGNSLRPAGRGVCHFLTRRSRPASRC